MFGQNQRVKQKLGDGLELQVKEIFPTIQGEGHLAGTPCVFLRLAGCNLACWFCDTDFENGQGMALDDVLTNILALFDEGGDRLDNLVVLTGGEPFVQNVVPLIRRLNGAGLRVQVETAGVLWMPGLEELFEPARDYKPQALTSNSIVCSPKTGKLNEHIVPYITTWKYVIKEGETANEDGLPVGSSQVQGQENLLARPHATVMKRAVFVQPCDEHDAEKNAVNAAEALRVALKYGYRLSVQIHKLECVNVP
tara:strand:- start:3728 stop:4483 length:756 start_codon:yes stop_codon:yes gene_type:complete